MRLAPLAAACLLALALSGCLRSGVEASLYNDTEEAVVVPIRVAPQGSPEIMTYSKNIEAGAGEGPIDLGRIITTEGDFVVTVGEPGAADRVEQTVRYTRSGGPDHITIRIGPDGARIDVAVV